VASDDSHSRSDNSASSQTRSLRRISAAEFAVIHAKAVSFAGVDAASPVGARYVAGSKPIRSS
jgi:hypothetical protein